MLLITKQHQIMNNVLLFYLCVEDRLLTIQLSENILVFMVNYRRDMWNKPVALNV